jgi:hypothetical protein
VVSEGTWEGDSEVLFNRCAFVLHECAPILCWEAVSCYPRQVPISQPDRYLLWVGAVT